MNRSLITVFATVLLCGSLMARSPQPSSGTTPTEPQTPSTSQPAASPTSTPAHAGTAPASTTFNIAPGTVVLVKLTKSINAKKAKKGDEVVAKVTQDLRNTAGTIIVPKDTKVVGHVTEAQALSKEQKESELAIAFDHAVLKNGEAMQRPMSIQAIIAPPNSNPGDSASGPPTQETRDTTAAVPAGRSGPGVPPPGTTAPQAPTGPGGAPAQARPQITANTQGVVGIADLKLSAAPDAKEGSLVTSEKNNVKLDDGTLLLLRVNQ
jgi:hypothetical protein